MVMLIKLGKPCGAWPSGGNIFFRQVNVCQAQHGITMVRSDLHNAFQQLPSRNEGALP